MEILQTFLLDCDVLEISSSCPLPSLGLAHMINDHIDSNLLSIKDNIRICEAMKFTSLNSYLMGSLTTL